jgi:hypothetical protein
MVTVWQRQSTGFDNGRVIYFGVLGVRGHNSKVEQVGSVRWN